MKGLNQFLGILLMIGIVSGLFWGGQQLGRWDQAQQPVDLTSIPTPELTNELLSRSTTFPELLASDPGVEIHPIEGLAPLLLENIELEVAGVGIPDAALIIAPAHVHHPALTEEEESLNLIPEEDN